MSQRTKSKSKPQARKPVMRSIPNVEQPASITLPAGVTSSGQIGVLRELAERVLVRDKDLDSVINLIERPSIQQMREQYALALRAVELFKIADTIFSGLVECEPSIDWIDCITHQLANNNMRMIREWLDEVVHEMGECIAFDVATQEEVEIRSQQLRSQLLERERS
jgi:hypothetical protein